MKKSLLMLMLAMTFGVFACDEPELKPGDDTENPGDNPGGTPSTGNLPKFDFPFYDAFPIECGNLIQEGSEVGVTIEVKKVEDNNFAFEFRPGPLVKSFKFDVYPLANLYNRLLNDKNSGDLKDITPVKIKERIRSYLFNEGGSGGYALSVTDFDNAEDFLQIPLDWMSTDYAPASAIAIPDCGFIIAAVGSSSENISSGNQEEITLCYVHTTSQGLIGDPQCEIQVVAGYNAFSVHHHPNSDAAAIYFFGSLSEEIQDYIDTFGDRMFRDYVRTLYSAPTAVDNFAGLTYSKDYPQADENGDIISYHNINSTTVVVAVDANGTPQEDYSRYDFNLRKIPDDMDIPDPKIEILSDRVASAYFEFNAEYPKECRLICYRVYSEAEYQKWQSASSKDRKLEAIDMVNNGAWRIYNPNFRWNSEDEVATGAAAQMMESCFGFNVKDGENAYVGYTGLNGIGTPGPLTFTEAIPLDKRNYTSPDNCQVKDLKLYLSNPSRTSFKQNITYDPATVSMVHVQYLPEEINISQDINVEEWVPWQEYLGLTIDSPWDEWIDLMFGLTGRFGTKTEALNLNHWKNVPSGSDPWTWTGMEPGVEYTVFLCAEDFDGNISPMKFAKLKTTDVQVGPDPTVNMSLVQDGDKWRVDFKIDHDVEYYLYCRTDNAADLGINKLTQSGLRDIANSGIPYEDWVEGIYEWVAKVGMSTNGDTSLDFEGDRVQVLGCLAVGQDASGSPVYKMNHLIYKNGQVQTLEEIFNIE